MRFNLKVPFAEKDEAKKLGARWDAGKKLWYIQDKEDLAPFARWSPSPQAAASAPTNTRSASSAQRTPAPDLEATTAFERGRHYVEQARVCECLPWEVCDKSRATALPGVS